MNNIDTSLIADPLVEQPFLGPSLKFLQGAAKDALKGALLAMVGPTYSASTVYILSGCVNSLVLPNYNISAGYVFFNGEVIYCPAVSGVVPGGKTLYSAIDVAYATVGTPDPVTGVTPDPVMFSDGSNNSVHEVRTWKIQYLTTGTGVNAFSTFAQLYSGRSFLSASAGAQTCTSAAPTWQDLTSITVTTPNDNRTRLYLIGYTCTSAQSQGGVSAQIEIQILQGATQVDIKTVGKLNSTAPGVDSFNIGTAILKPVLVPPNTIIKGQFRYTNLACTVDQQELWAIEIF